MSPERKALIRKFNAGHCKVAPSPFERDAIRDLLLALDEAERKLAEIRATVADIPTYGTSWSEILTHNYYSEKLWKLYQAVRKTP